MNWTEIVAEVNAKDVDTAGNIAQMTVPYGIYIEDYSNLEEEVLEIAHIDLIDEELLKMDRSKAKIHIYISPEDNPNEALLFLKKDLPLKTLISGCIPMIVMWRAVLKIGKSISSLSKWVKNCLSAPFGEMISSQMAELCLTLNQVLHLARVHMKRQGFVCRLLKSMLLKIVQCLMWAVAAVFYPLRACFWGQSPLLAWI